MQKSRASYVIKNVKWGYICTFVTYFLGFILRTIIIKCLGENYAGINGLFTNILGVLSFAELGIGTALNYSLYKPVADNDNEKIKSLMLLYKKAYRVIAIVVGALGICLLPFLDYLVKDPGNIGNIKLYYVIYLFNTVTSYFVTYKYSLANAKQENYICSIVTMVSLVATYIFQIVALLSTRNFTIYLIVGAVIDLIQKIWISRYLDKKYPILIDKNVKVIEPKEKSEIWKNTKALIYHKIGDVSVHQTDNIIISAFVNVSMVGKVTYYSYFINAVHQMLVVALNAAVGSLGNAISEETQERQYEIFKVYRFVAFWLYGFLSIGLYLMLTKLTIMLVGKGIAISNSIVMLMVLDFYMIGHRCALNNMKMAGGVFVQDKYLSIVQAVVNLVVSIVLVRIWGVIGVFVGTIVQGTISTIVRPIIVYPTLFGKTAVSYYVDSLKYGAVLLLAGSVSMMIDHMWFSENTVCSFVVEVIVLSIVINSIFLAIFYRSKPFVFLMHSLNGGKEWKLFH